MGVSAISTSCGNENGFASLFGDGGTTPYFYDIGFGGQFSGSFPSLAAGDYNSMITDGNGCITEQAITIQPSVAPVAVAEAAMPISCNDEEVTVTSENSTYVGDVDYIWNTDDGVIVGDDASETIMVSSAGTYTLKIIEIFTGCISETTVEVEDISLLPSISIASVEEINCDITQITIDGSDSEDGDNLVYEWTTTDGNIIGDVDGDIIDVDLEGTYTLSISNSVNGCVSTQSITVEADIEVPVIDLSNNVLTCSAIDVEICATVTAGHSVVWTTETGDISQICITVNAAGDYIATVSAPNGCTNSAVSVVTASTDLPVVSVANPNVLTCTQETVQVSVVVENASADDIITWTDADGNLIAEGSSDVLISTPGTYEVSVTNNLGCTTITSVTVEEDINSPVATFEYSVNNDGLVTLNSTSDESGSVTWTLADGTVLTGGDAEFSVSISGEYEVCMTYVNECGADENCQTVVYSTLLAVSIDKTDLTCYLSADGNISAMVSGGAQGYTYYWIGPDGFESTEPSISNLSAGIYTLLVGDQDGTEINSEVTITQPEVLMISSLIVVEEEDGLSNGSIDISVIGGTGDFTYEWSNGGTTAKIENLSAGEYSVIITDANGCTYSENEIIVGTITDVTDLDVVEDFFMYPVPAYDFINVKTTFNGSQAVNVNILDATGKVIWSRSYLTTQIEETIDLTSFPSGIYTLSMISRKSIQLENFIVLK